ncbi:MAG TPA: pyruvate carboxyltransferase [Phycisphaerae bacterium]|nr:pyruvate carboxyltransferase [Phycisphaerales bacterium]HRX87139.1 pyruvate carboxyltransferase [Phycisphaerae bacterium]
MFSAINRKVKRFVLRQQKKKPLVLISDTTLRDGVQMSGVRLQPADKVRIAQALADAGVHSIDCGFPAAGETECEGVRQIARRVKGPTLSALSRTVLADIDLAAEALEPVSPLKRAITLFIGTSPLHRDHKHEMAKAQIIDTACRAIDYAQKHFEIISFGPEDASRTEPEFLFEVYEKAIQAGALSIGFTDTVGILTPAKSADIVKRIQDNVASMDDAMLGVHFHNDLGLATANSLACVQAGANIVQGTVNGIGERAGNVAIEEVIMALVLHADEFKKGVTVNPRALAGLCSLVAELTGFEPAANKAVIGRNIFRTEAGIHQDGILAHPDTYLPFPPETIGAGPVELVLGAQSGRSAVRHHLAATGLDVNEEHVELVLGYLKGRPHNPADYPEIDEFLERLQPYMADDLAAALETRTKREAG